MFLLLLFTVTSLTANTISVEITIFPKLPITVQTDGNILCNIQSKQYMDNLENFTLWAYEMRDASAQSATGILRGRSFNPGNQEQCLTSKAPFPTQYCLAVITANITNPKTSRDSFSLDFNANENILNKLYNYNDDTKFPRNVVKMGWCFPASCSPSDAQDILNGHLQTVDYELREENVTFSAIVPASLCQRSDEQSGLDATDICFCALVALILCLVIIGTYLEGRYNMDNLKNSNGLSTYKLIKTYSLTTNFKDLSKPDGSVKSLTILNGMKTISMIMIVMAHRFALFAASPQLTVESLEVLYRKTWAAEVFHADLFVDTFFFVSGLLITYIFLSKFGKLKVNPLLIILARYLRLTPIYAFMIFYQATIFYHTGNGPLWEPVIGQERRDCRKNWWTGLLYISNFVDSEHMCMVQSWYLPCDFHYFVVALLLLYLFHKNKLFALIGIGLCMLATIVTTFGIIYVNERTAFLRFLPTFFTNPKVDYDFNLIYIKSYTRGLPYFFGMIAGYIHHTLKGTDYKISKVQSYVIQTISYFLICVLIFSSTIFYDPYHKYNVIEASLYGSIHRLIWALGTFGFLYAVSFGPTGFIYKFLSWKGFIPLSRLAYGAYLWHVGFQLREIGSATGPRKFIIFDVLGRGVLDVVFSLALSLATFLTIEQPLQKIVHIFLYHKLFEDVEKNKQPTITETTEENKV